MPESNDPNLDSSGQDSGYVVVARRYRPRGFDELVGQDHVSRALKNAIETNRVGHAYLFTGARGVGKTSSARIFAKALNDPGGPTATPDNTSDTALAIDSGEDVDVIEIDGASNRGIDEIRSLRANVGVRPSRSRFKIYIIDEVHMLTGAAFNALLKTLEEPPEHVKFIFCTTDPEKIPITVLSRCQRFDFAPVEVSKIVMRLREIVTAENAQADDKALELIARRAAGSMRDSQSLLEQVLSFCDSNLTADQVHSMLGTADDERLHALAKAMADRDAAGALAQMDAGVDAGVDAGRLAEQLLGYFRDLMAVTVGCDETMLRHTSVSLHPELKALGERWGLQTVLAVVGLIDQTLVRIRHSVYARVLLEATMIQICSLPDLQHIADLAAAASSVGGSVSAAKAVEKKNVTNSAAPDVPASQLDPAPVAAAAPVEPPVDEAVTTRPTEPISAETPAPMVSAVAEASVAAVAVAGAASAVAVATPPAAQPSTAAAEPSREPTVEAAQPEPATETATTVKTLTKRALTRDSAQQIWDASLEHVETATATLARPALSAQLISEDTIGVTFPGKLSAVRFDVPEHKNAIANVLSEIASRNIKIDCKVTQSKVVEAKPKVKQSGVDKMQRLREIQTHPLVTACNEVFGTEIVKIDHPK